jgi:DNA mismatch repair protein MutS2
MERWTCNVLEFAEVKAMVQEEATTVLGKEKVEAIHPSADFEEVKRRLDETKEALDFLRIKGDLSLGGVRDLRMALKRAKLGGVLYEQDCLEIASTLKAGRKWKNLMKQIDEETAPLPILRSLTRQISVLEPLEKEITDCIDEQGMVKDSASPALRSIRQQMDLLKSRIQQTLQQLLRNPATQKMLQDAIITKRQDRYVVPVKAEYRGAFGGIVHDQSSSGATLFIEPQAVVQLNNQLREQELAEKREVERILRQLTEKVAAEAEAIEQTMEALATIDFIIAKARFAVRKNGIVPKLTSEKKLRLKQARHPLLPPDKVVPIDVAMGDPYTAVIITGPNTGGKTVTLKTIGLFSLMTQCGFPILAEEDSVMPVFSGVFADIGDEQSIEQSLSTFSGHMSNIIQILKQIDERSLVLFDELGAGTDPTEGAALAIAILEHVIDRGATVVATTHYNELKLFAHNHPLAVNASVEFDVETLRPTYRLLIGVPGQSKAFAISKRLGLPEEIIASARNYLSKEEIGLEEMIASLSQEKKKAEEERKEAEQLRKEAEKLYQEMKQKWEKWQEEKAAIREKAREEARSIVARAKREAEEIIQELRQWARQRPQDLKEHLLDEARKKLESAVPDDPLLQKEAVVANDDVELQEGDEVRVLSWNQKGTIVEKISDEEFLVQMGMIKMKIPRNQLEKLKTAQKPAAKPSATLVRKSPDVRPELDIRGKLVEEAILDVDKYLDAAILAGYKQVSIIHGKGTGALRAGIQQFLRSHRNVKSFRMGSHGEGGAGVTIVELR